MTLYEAKQLVERAGYSVVKKNHEVTKKDFVTKKYDKDSVEIDDNHDIVVKKKQRKLARKCPCCGRSHCICSSAVKEALAVAEKAGFQVISERIGDSAGTKLSEVCEKWLRNAFFEKVANAASLEVAKAQFLEDVSKLVDHGVSGPKYNEICFHIDESPNLNKTLLYIAGLMQTAQGRGLRRDPRRGW